MSDTEQQLPPQRLLSLAVLTRKQFCELANISITTFHELRNNGAGPREMHFPGTSTVRISIEAYHAWRREREEFGQTEAAKLEEARRSEIAKAAGLKAAQSALHVSKRKAAQDQKPVRIPRRSAKG